MVQTCLCYERARIPGMFKRIMPVAKPQGGLAKAMVGARNCVLQCPSHCEGKQDIMCYMLPQSFTVIVISALPHIMSRSIAYNILNITQHNIT